MTYTPLETTASQICNSPYAMVYGFDSCHYNEVNEGLRYSSLFKHIFDYNLGYEGHDEAHELSPSIQQVKTSKVGTADTCKAALVNIVFENCKRKRLGQPLIPVLFVIDCEKNLHSLSSKDITTKEESKNKIITFKEIRRAYKLCEEIDDPEIRAVAKETFKFVKAMDDLSLKEISAPWEKSDWNGLWATRKQTPKKHRKKPNWKSELQKMKDTLPKSKKSASKLHAHSLHIEVPSSSSSSSSTATTSITSSKDNSFASISSDSSESTTSSMTSPLTAPPTSYTLSIDPASHLDHRRKVASERSSLERLFIRAL